MSKEWDLLVTDEKIRKKNEKFIECYGGKCQVLTEKEMREMAQQAKTMNGAATRNRAEVHLATELERIRQAKLQSDAVTSSGTIPIKHSSHNSQITRGVIGEFSKIQEEFEEAKDAMEQGIHTMLLWELGDLVGAIGMFLKKYYPGISIHDLVKQAQHTRKLFESGARIDPDGLNCIGSL